MLAVAKKFVVGQLTKTESYKMRDDLVKDGGADVVDGGADDVEKDGSDSKTMADEKICRWRPIRLHARPPREFMRLTRS